METHSEHLINQLRYQIYQQKLQPEQVVLYYKADERAPFDCLHINRYGHFVSAVDQPLSFPTGFFDATLGQLLEIG